MLNHERWFSIKWIFKFKNIFKRAKIDCRSTSVQKNYLDRTISLTSFLYSLDEYLISWGEINLDPLPLDLL